MEPLYIDYLKKKKHSFNVYDVAIMVYRDHLYERKIVERLYPIIYLPEDPSIAMIVPSEIYKPRPKNSGSRNAEGGLRLKW